MYKLDEGDELTHGRCGHRPPHRTRSAWLAVGCCPPLRLSAVCADASLRRDPDGLRVLSEESVSLMRSDRLTPDERHLPGAPFLSAAVSVEPFGGDRPSRSPSCSGRVGSARSWPGAYGTWWQADPSQDLILVYLTQNLPNWRRCGRRRGGQHLAPKLRPHNRSSSGAPIMHWVSKWGLPHDGELPS